MKFNRLSILSGIVIIGVSWFSINRTGKHTLKPFREKSSHSLQSNTDTKLNSKAAAAKIFSKREGYNSSICFLIDMSIESGKNRFFIYDLQKDSLLNEGLVAHGNCFEYWLEKRRYSNVVGCGCTSLGKYKIGASYIGKFGYSYKLHGLDSTNNNAFERTVVLHSYSCVPDQETAGEICQSNGCPMVSPGFLQQLKAIIKSSKKPLLLWIYE